MNDLRFKLKIQLFSDEPPNDTEPTDHEPKEPDLTPREKALQELLDETRATNQKLTEEMEKIQIANEKMLLKFGGEKQTTEDFYSSFSKYEKRK